MPRSLPIGFEDAMDPVMILGHRRELIVHDDPDRHLNPAECRAEAKSQNPKGLPLASIVRTDPFPEGRRLRKEGRLRYAAGT